MCRALLRMEPLSRNAESGWGGEEVEFALRLKANHVAGG